MAKKRSSPKSTHHPLEWAAVIGVAALLGGVLYGATTGAINVPLPGPGVS